MSKRQFHALTPKPAKRIYAAYEQHGEDGATMYQVRRFLGWDSGKARAIRRHTMALEQAGYIRLLGYTTDPERGSTGPENRPGIYARTEKRGLEIEQGLVA